MRICFISHGSGRGGAEEVLLETLECLMERNIECRVVMPGDMGLGEDLRRLNVPYTKLPFWTWMGHKTIWDRVQVLGRNALLSIPAYMELRRWNPDIIYTNTMTVFFGAILARLLGRPHVWHLHELGYKDHGLTFDLGSRFSYWIINSASACIAVSRITAETFAPHVDSKKLRVMFQSVHRRAHWPDSSGGVKVEPVPPKKQKLRCIIVGRLSEGKRQEDAVLAMAELRQMGVDAELLVIGRSNPGYRERLEILIQKHKLEDRVHIIGAVLDRLPYVQSADIVLMCSRCEAFGRVTVEGMLAAKPVVATRSGANPELIREGVNGLLYEVADHRDLAEKIRYLHDNPELIPRMGSSGKSWSERIFNKDRFANELVPFLESVAKNQTPITPVPLKDQETIVCR